ncbi:uncharacterized protein LOC124663731 [Lolium rigidum]|uniref:uncharacterized protein LOC124663731 n=1 Tax=Lolium rigidum TaxID=89674 RepID=UPI001F5D24EE|nr:uncharacterized protein LOC124663731 [Lolium rigidum]
MAGPLRSHSRSNTAQTSPKSTPNPRFSLRRRPSDLSAGVASAAPSDGSRHAAPQGPLPGSAEGGLRGLHQASIRRRVHRAFRAAQPSHPLSGVRGGNPFFDLLLRRRAGASQLDIVPVCYPIPVWLLRLLLHLVYALSQDVFALSYVGLLAFVVHTLFSSVLGVVFIYSDSILAAGLFGSVLAQHREVNGRETAAAVAFSKAPFTRIYYRQDGIYPFLAFFALFGAICWVMRPEGHYDALTTVMNLFAAIACLEFILTVCVLGWLNGAVFGMDSAPPVVFIFAAIGMQFPISYLLGGKLVAAIILWLCVLASTAFLGYYLRVHATYEQMMFTRDAMKIRNARTIRNSAGVVPTKSNTPTPATASFTKETNTDASAAAVSP